MTPSRETIMEALLERLKQIAGNGKPVNGVYRRVRSWADSAPKPCVYIGEHSDEYSRQSENLPKASMSILLFVYTQTGDMAAIPSKQQNEILDAIDDALKPDNPSENKCTLGGLVSHCYIDGTVVKVPGDLDGEGIAVVPINILVP